MLRVILLILVFIFLFSVPAVAWSMTQQAKPQLPQKPKGRGGPPIVIWLAPYLVAHAASVVASQEEQCKQDEDWMPMLLDIISL